MSSPNRRRRRETAPTGFIDELRYSPAGTVAAIVSVLGAIIPLLLGGDSSRGASSGIDIFGWISTSGMPVRAIIFIVYAATIGWSLGFVTALLVGYGRGTLPNIGYLAAVLWGFAQQGSASWLFAKERDAGTHVYELMMVFGLFISVWLVRQSMESSRRIGQGAGVACARLILIYVLSAIVCAGLLELGNAKH